MSNVKNNTEKSRYELVVEGHLAIADYRLEGDRLSITHVFVPEELRGRGVAAQVMQGVVEDAKTRGFSINPVCPYAASYLKRHPL